MLMCMVFCSENDWDTFFFYDEPCLMGACFLEKVAHAWSRRKIQINLTLLKNWPCHILLMAERFSKYIFGEEMGDAK